MIFAADDFVVIFIIFIYLFTWSGIICTTGSEVTLNEL